MSEEILDDEVLSLISQIKDKYNTQGQNFKSYLEGLLYQDYTHYWDYIAVDSLLTLQKPKTLIPDEMIFIIYHQITELYFKLSLHEMEQIVTSKNNIDVHFFAERVRRINAYFNNLTHSFEIMVNGMEPEQFLKFRMSLLPASGFQSAQYRMIEIYATEFINLVNKEKREEVKELPIDQQFNHIYWQAGATESDTGKKTLTLTKFEQKYGDKLKRLACQNKENNLWTIYQTLSETDKQNETLKAELRKFDLNVNVNWPLMHYKSAVKYLQKPKEDVPATGGTNWQKYLPPRFQLRIFYPELFTTDELNNWGKF
ncbi:MAG: tryptophan 2,3-dioxygenase family protein [Bacteroidota bacterium]